MLNLEKIKNFKSKESWFFRFKKNQDWRYLLTNDLWYFCFLEKNDFLYFIWWNIDKINTEKSKELKNKLFIKNYLYEQNLIKWYNKKNWYIHNWPSLHIMVLTLRCNHACKYCHASVVWEKDISKDMTIETAKKIVDTIFFTTSNNITIEFQWWEPLLNFEVLKFIVDYARNKAFYLKKNLWFALVSNLSLMDEEKLDYIMNNDISMSTSLDGNEEVHNFNRTFNKWNSFEKVTYWIKKINNEYKKRWINRKIWALATITKKSLDKHKEIIDTYVNLWLNSIFLRPLNPYWFATKNLKELWYTYEDFNNFYNKSIDYILQLNINWLEFKEYFTTIFLQKILNNTDPNFLDERSPCWASIWQVAYNYNWKIYTCDEWRMFSQMGDENFNIGDVHIEEEKKCYVNMIENETTKTMMISSITDILPWYKDSVYKPYIWICPIYNYKKNGNTFWNFSIDSRLKISYNTIDNIFNRIENEKFLNIFKNWVWGEDLNKNCF